MRKNPRISLSFVILSERSKSKDLRLYVLRVILSAASRNLIAGGGVEGPRRSPDNHNCPDHSPALLL